MNEKRNKIIRKCNNSEKVGALRKLCSIPGVGKSISLDLWNLGIHSIEDLKNMNPELLYKNHCIQIGRTVDRCLLYVFRCAVYYASNKQHKPKLLLWWNWKDKKQA